MNPLRLGYLNSVMLIGRLTADPELRYTQKGTPMCNFRIANSRRWKNRETGEPQEERLFINVVAWRRQAELANDFLKKGSAVLIEGNLQSRQWENTKGEKRTTIEIVARKIEFLDAQQREGEAEADSTAAVDVPVDNAEETKDDEGIDTPF